MTSPAEPVPTEGRPARDDTGAERAFRRRALTVAAVLLAAAGAALWGSSRLTWATLVAEDGLSPQRTFDVHGADWSPWLTPVAIVLVAAIAAAVSVRGWPLRLTSLVVAVIGVVGLLPVISLLTTDNASGYAARAVDVPGRYQVLSVDVHGEVTVLVIVGGLLAVAASVVLLRAASGSATLSTRYRSPAARRAELEEKVFAERARTQNATGAPAPGDAPDSTADPGGADSAADSVTAAEGVTASREVTERMLWDALDSGDDPTASRDPNATGRPGGSGDTPPTR